MRTKPSVIMLEFNELTPSLMDRFMREGYLPNFARLHRESRVFTTDAEESGWNLEPWIQWVTVHTGLSAAEHGIRELGEAHKLKHRGLTEILSEANLRVWTCGSMNARYDSRLNGAFLPDAWTTDVQPQPRELTPYYQFISQYVHEHTRDADGLKAADYLGFLKFMVTHGFSLSTAMTIALQLARDRGGKHRWKRVAVMDRLQWDVFRWYYRTIQPHFATFFLNSTAHLQHKHWRNLEPERFTIKPTDQEQHEFEQAVIFGYQQMDELVGRFIKLAGDDTTLVFCTGLSQQACLLYEESGGKSFYRPRDIHQFLAFAGVTAGCRYFPVMSEQFRLQFDDERQAAAAARVLSGFHVSGQAAMYVRQEGAEIFGGCCIFSQVAASANLESPESNRAIPFFDLFYQSEGVKSGMHHPDGMLWIRTPDRAHAIEPEKVSLLSIAPTILRLFGVTPPRSMKAGALDLAGRQHAADVHERLTA